MDKIEYMPSILVKLVVMEADDGASHEYEEGMVSDDNGEDEYEYEEVVESEEDDDEEMVESAE